MLNWWINPVPAGYGWGIRARDAASAEWQVTPCDPIRHAGSRSGAVLLAQTAIRFVYRLPELLQY